MVVVLNQVRKYFLLCAVLLTALALKSQAPGLINYQAVARNTLTGSELSNQDVFLQALVRSGGPSGTVVYQESHDNTSTNQFGLFNIQIGGGEATMGSLLDIDWASGPYWLEIELDAGEGLQSMGAMQLVAVPYALHAATADSVENVDDADADPSNELLQDVSFNSDSSQLNLTDAGGNYAVDLSPLINDADADPDNERITGVFYNNASNTITISEGGQNYSSGLGPVDLDIDPGNELIDEDGLVLTDDNVLQISEAGVSHEVDLSSLANESPWVSVEDENIVYNVEDNIGIGTTTPEALLQIDQGQSPGTPGLSVLNGADAPRFEVSGDTVRSYTNAVHWIEGQVRYKPVVIQSSSTEAISYTVQSQDHYIVVVGLQGVINTVDISLPEPADFEGRIVHIVKIGFGSSVLNINIIPEGEMNFGAGFTEFEDADRLTIAFLSLGSLGWVSLE